MFPQITPQGPNKCWFVQLLSQCHDFWCWQLSIQHTLRRQRKAEWVPNSFKARAKLKNIITLKFPAVGLYTAKTDLRSERQSLELIILKIELG